MTTNSWRTSATTSATSAYTLNASGPSADGLCQQLSGYVTGSAKYQSSPQPKRLVPNALVAGACGALKLIKPNTSPLHKHLLIEVFNAKVWLLRTGGWLSTEQATTLKNQADTFCNVALGGRRGFFT